MPDRAALRAPRARIVEAMAQVVAERGVGGASVGLVCTRARVSRHTYRAWYADVDECVMAVMRVGTERVCAIAVAEFERADGWFDGVRGALAGVLAFFDSEPALAWVYVVESLRGGPAVLAWREQCVRKFGRTVVELIEREPSIRVAPELKDGAVTCALGAIHAHMVTGQPGPLLGLHSRLMGLIAALFAGADEIGPEIQRTKAVAQATLAQATPARATPARDAPARDAPEGDMDRESRAPVPAELADPRAHRARECLLFVAAQARQGRAPSNSDVGLATGIGAPAQVSALLSRLADLGLLIKRSHGPGRANEWRVTTRGASVARSLAGDRGVSHARPLVGDGGVFGSRPLAGDGGVLDSRPLIVGDGGVFGSQVLAGDGGVSGARVLVGDGGVSDLQALVGDGGASDLQALVGDGGVLDSRSLVGDRGVSDTRPLAVDRGVGRTGAGRGSRRAARTGAGRRAITKNKYSDLQ